MRAVALRQPAFIAFDAAQARRRAGMDGPRQFQRLAGRPRAGALAGDAHFQQHVEDAPAAARARPVLDEAQLRDGIDQEPHAQVLVPGEQRVEPVQVGGRRDLVGDEGAAQARLQPDGKLVDRREGQSPGAAPQLQVEQLGRHRGLAVRRESDVAAPGIVLHPAHVVLQGRPADHRQRIGQVVREHVPAALGDPRGVHGLRRERKALVAVIDQKIRMHGVVLSLVARVHRAFQQACRCPPPTSRNRMSAWAQRLSASGQRVRNTQPLGGFLGLGRSPDSNGIS
ncbi:hypothetical protein CDEN61S_04051 [Castellaniella denitrificans]